jgi:regulator of sigma D
MSDQHKKVHERRSNTVELIDHMLVERKQLLSLLMKVSELENEELNDADQGLLDEFCQVLVDYIAAGHFGLYDRIIKKQERRKNVSDLALGIYPSIDQTTQTVLSFNEKYDPDNGSSKLSELQADLSTLGERLASRIELEDRLINCLQEPRETARN